MPALDPRSLDTLRQLTTPGEPDVLAQVLRLFLDEAPRRLDRLHSALAQGNAGEFQRAAHSLKGAAGNIGATALRDAARRADELGASGRLEAAAPLVTDIERRLGEVVTEIERLLTADR
jgi:HPt (histidine-containing phosphotransfer) domain-containing protein